jgi:aryl-alcohol dehydrogenase-like predicted oxidoreductase
MPTRPIRITTTASASSTARSTPGRVRAGESEEIVGKALAGGKRDNVVLATNVHGTMGDDPNEFGNTRVRRRRSGH